MNIKDELLEDLSFPRQEHILFEGSTRSNLFHRFVSTYFLHSGVPK